MDSGGIALGAVLAFLGTVVAKRWELKKLKVEKQNEVRRVLYHRAGSILQTATLLRDFLPQANPAEVLSEARVLSARQDLTKHVNVFDYYSRTEASSFYALDEHEPFEFIFESIRNPFSCSDSLASIGHAMDGLIGGFEYYMRTGELDADEIRLAQYRAIELEKARQMTFAANRTTGWLGPGEDQEK
jgi:hypothetical protein